MKTNEASRTAEYMALFRAVETAETPARRFFEDAYAPSLLTGKLQSLAKLADVPFVGRSATWLLDAGWPRTRSSAVVRTKAIDDLVNESMDESVQQFVLLGAGFDTRPYRLPKLLGVSAFEVDHPSTQSEKRRRLSSCISGVPANVRFIPVDFEIDDFAQELVKAGFDCTVRSVVVWEGVISYLSAGAVHESFMSLARILSPSSRLIFTYVDQGALDGSVSFAEAKRWKASVESTGEPFTFGFVPEELGEYLREHGFTLINDESTTEAARPLNARFRRYEKGSELYRIAVAERACGNDSSS